MSNVPSESPRRFQVGDRVKVLDAGTDRKAIGKVLRVLRVVVSQNYYLVYLSKCQQPWSVSAKHGCEKLKLMKSVKQ